jgi:magnesium chelatase family protein
MVSKVCGAMVEGIEARPIIVEVRRSRGLPGTDIVGLARGAAKESIIRVRAVLSALGLSLGAERLIVNLLPADLPKEASALDLPLAMALLCAGGYFSPESLAHRRFFAEISLSGELQPVRGAVLAADLASREADKALYVAAASAPEAAMVPGVQTLGIGHIDELLAHLKGELSISASVATMTSEPTVSPCLSEVYGQRHVKRSLEIAAAGEHNLLLIGPPGSGKSMLAKRLPGILPPLSIHEKIAISRIHSLIKPPGSCLSSIARPFRAPHHSASEVAICGGGGTPRPGEISLAHHGVLFMDEMPEFNRRALESLREPLEEGSIHVARAKMSIEFPARFLFVGAMNPCPCGWYQGELLGSAGDGRKGSCLCSYEQILRYRARLSGPLLERIDMHVFVDALPYREYFKADGGEKSEAVQQRVLAARTRQEERQGSGLSNARLSSVFLHRILRGDVKLRKWFELVMEKERFSARVIEKVLRLARTIADLDGSCTVQLKHAKEALAFRLLDRSVFRA